MTEPFKPATADEYIAHFLNIAAHQPYRALEMMAEELAMQNASRLAAEEECAALKKQGFYRGKGS